MARGGKREGAGRPKGSVGEIQRKNRNIRATDEEWEQIKWFTKFIKYDKFKAEMITSNIKKELSNMEKGIDVKILMADYCTEAEAKKYLLNGTTIYPVEEWDNKIADDSGRTLAEIFGEKSEEIRKSNSDLGYVEYEGEKYIIMYVL